MHALGISVSPNFKTAFICSNHFKVDCYTNVENDQRTRQKLMSTAIPSVIKPVSQSMLIVGEEGVNVPESNSNCDENTRKTFASEERDLANSVSTTGDNIEKICAREALSNVSEPVSQIVKVVAEKNVDVPESNGDEKIENISAIEENDLVNSVSSTGESIEWICA